MSKIRISLWNSLEKVILYMLKISTKFSVVPQSFCENQNSVQNQDQDQDLDITLDFDTVPTFQTSTKFCFDPLTPSKVIVSTWKVHTRTDRQTDRQTHRQTYIHTYIHTATQTGRQTDRQTYIQTYRRTDGNFFCLFCLPRHTKHEHLSKVDIFFFHSCDYNTFSFYILRMWWESKKIEIK